MTEADFTHLVAELAAKLELVTAERDALRDELERVRSGPRRRKADQRRSRDQSRDDPVESRDKRSARVVSLKPTSLPNQPSVEKPSNNLTSGLPALSPQSGTSLVRRTMDVTTLTNGRPVSRPEPPPPDFGITPEAIELVDRCEFTVGMADSIVRAVRREVTRLLDKKSHTAILHGMQVWYWGDENYAADENLHPGNIKYWVEKVERGTPASAKERRLTAIQRLKDQDRKEVR